MGLTVAVVGATGAVGERMLKVLAERQLPVDTLKALASSRSVGRTVKYGTEDIAVEELTESSFEGVDLALFSIPKEMSRRFAPAAVKSGCVVVDNSNAFRMDPDTPLVVPEVNPDAIDGHNGIIANPNCSTIQMVVALNPLHKAATIRRVIVTTFQAVSGAGYKALEELDLQTRAVLEGKEYAGKVFPHRMAFNVLPQIPQSDAFVDGGYTSEEMKMVNETRKIMGDDSIMVNPTCVRVPVLVGHSEQVAIETERKLSADEARGILEKAPGIVVMDDTAREEYPLPTNTADRDETFVGRIREDISTANGLNLWVVADNLRKGAATNAVQIAEEWIRRS